MLYTLCFQMLHCTQRRILCVVIVHTYFIIQQRCRCQWHLLWCHVNSQRLARGDNSSSMITRGMQHVDITFTWGWRSTATVDVPDKFHLFTTPSNNFFVDMIHSLGSTGVINVTNI